MSFFTKKRILKYIFAFLLISFSFFFKGDSIYMNTIGLSILYIGFGLILSLFVSDFQINQKLNKLFSKTVINSVAIIGFYSYSIYLFHYPFRNYSLSLIRKNFQHINPGIEFFLYFLGSIFTGIIISKLFEQRFLNLRDRLYPSRSKSIK